MVIKVCKTTEWSDRDWETYVIGYNEVFGTDETIADFKNKYFSVCKGGNTFDLKIDVGSESDEWVSLGRYDVFDCIKIIQYDKQELLSLFSFFYFVSDFSRKCLKNTFCKMFAAI